MGRFLYYLIILYFFVFIGTLFALYVEDLDTLEHVRVSFGGAIFYLWMGIPYNIFSVIIVLFIFYFNEVKRNKSNSSFLTSYLIGIAFLIVYASISSTIRSERTRRDISFWDSLNFSNDTIFDHFKLFLLGTFLFTLLMIPIHNYCRRKYTFINEAK